MQLGFDAQIPALLPLAACTQLAEKPRQGFNTISSTMHWASGFVISHTPLGVSGSMYDSRIRSRCTGKERDTESGLDYFGARYYASNMGRWMSPDWADKPEAVPYSSLDNPQSLNLYGYAQNNPLKIVDTDGHELIVASQLQSTVNTMRQQSASFNAELSAHEGANAPNLTIKFGATPNDPGGQPSIGNTSAALSVDGIGTISRPDEDSGVYGYHGATVTINDSISGDSKEVSDTLGHEVGHVNDARTNTTEFGRDSEHTKETHGKTPHDSRPEEQRANAFKNKVNNERKESQKEQKREKKDNQ
jgi:RHS repeat-associated protein